jgi:hypothetical protein
LATAHSPYLLTCWGCSSLPSLLCYCLPLCHLPYHLSSLSLSDEEEDEFFPLLGDLNHLKSSPRKARLHQPCAKCYNDRFSWELFGLGRIRKSRLGAESFGPMCSVVGINYQKRHVRHSRKRHHHKCMTISCNGGLIQPPGVN